MSLWAIIPVKALRRGKTRLAGVLTEDEREVLNLSLLGHTLKVINQVEGIEQVLVVSSDTAVLALAREQGAKTVQEDGNPGLNTALHRATMVAQMYAAQGVLILPSDLPLLQTEDVKEMIQLSENPPVVVIAPDRRNEGTNAILIKPTGLIAYQFGDQSFSKHCSQAKRFNLNLKIVTSETLGLDLDLPEDLNMLQQFQQRQDNL
ncbi:MAG: 2-phospho-L-lactate guanylyltransferase [Leptolinea sp.]|jgi:2-phospho-L-lactate guanylyltransferase|nr:2-phospho-L-lactate guanylyltransferase [Leptolinea sp.]